MQQAFDRNDTADDLTSEDTRYGDWLDRFEGHLDTPTTTWVDALGRPIAVGEDNGVAAGADPEKAIRVTTYEVHPGLFTGTTLVLTLDHDLSENHFALVLGAVDATNSRCVDPAEARRLSCGTRTWTHLGSAGSGAGRRGRDVRCARRPGWTRREKGPLPGTVEVHLSIEIGERRIRRSSERC